MSDQSDTPKAAPAPAPAVQESPPFEIVSPNQMAPSPVPYGTTVEVPPTLLAPRYFPNILPLNVAKVDPRIAEMIAEQVAGAAPPVEPPAAVANVNDPDANPPGSLPNNPPGPYMSQAESERITRGS